jgi:hypothetical protein
MNLGKGLAFSAVGALAGAVVWIIVIKVTGLSLWVLAPIVGGAAGYGMMRATQMKGGAVSGLIAAVMALAAIFGARYYIVSQDVHEHLIVTQDDVDGRLQSQIAEEMQRAGLEVFDEEGEFTSKVQHEAQQHWYDMSEFEREQYIGALQAEYRQAAGFLTPLGLLFDFGIMGTICAALAVGTAFKTGSVTLEKALVEKGMAVSADDATSIASKMRAEDSSKRSRNTSKADEPDAPLRAGSGGIWSIPMQKAEDRPLKMVKVISSDDPKPESPQEPGQQQAAA